MAPTLINHGFNSKNHSGFNFGSGFGATIMQHLRILMVYATDAVPAVACDDPVLAAVGLLGGVR